MTTRKRKSKTAAAPLLQIGNHPGTIESAAKAIVEVCKAAGTEAAVIAAVNCLAQLAHAPQYTTITGCNFQGAP